RNVALIASQHALGVRSGQSSLDYWTSHGQGLGCHENPPESRLRLLVVGRSETAVRADYGLAQNERRIEASRCRKDWDGYAQGALPGIAAGTRACATSRQADANWKPWTTSNSL